MSNINNEVQQECDLLESCGAVKKLLKPKDKDLGGFSVRRVIPTVQMKTIGPWIFFDHMGPANFKPGEGVNVRPHPHIGIATATYLFDGEMFHQDSLGNALAIKPGDFNLMVAGKGIVHSEREREEVRQQPHTAHGLQLWLALPEEFEEMAPEFHHYNKDEIPTTKVNGIPLRVLMGEAYGLKSPVKTFSDTLYLEASLTEGQRLTLPNTDELGLYVISGQLTAKDTVIPKHSMAAFIGETAIEVIAQKETNIAIIGGASLGKRYIEWNFVSSRKERIEQAKEDWQQDRFAKVPNDDKECIPLPQ